MIGSFEGGCMKFVKLGVSCAARIIDLTCFYFIFCIVNSGMYTATTMQAYPIYDYSFLTGSAIQMLLGALVVSGYAVACIILAALWYSALILADWVVAKP